MTDRELLELAAKAAGKKVRIYPGMTVMRGTDCVCVDADTGLPWNPIVDDGDALRLAVRLHFMVDVRDNGAYTYVLGDFGLNSYESHGDDPCAATRRAITRAAAEIGKEMG